MINILYKIGLWVQSYTEINIFNLALSRITPYGNSANYWKDKYIALLEKYNALLEKMGNN
jgi:hypothetical protein